MLKKLLFVLMAVALPSLCFAQYNETSWPVVEVGSPAPSHQMIVNTGQTVTWQAGHVYHLQGFCFVDSGATLVIQPGTIVKGEPGQAANASVLVVVPGGKIIAQGTKALPIIFTTNNDMVADTADMPDIASSRGNWGGIVVQGRAFTAAIGDTSAVEGIPTFTSPAPFTARKTQYGGGSTPDCHDNSGVFSYISIRYAGSIFGSNVEVNGISLAGVGDGTKVDHLDFYYSLDDDIETWGGSVNVLYTSIWYGDDDGWDTDEGWAGIRQFGVEVKDPRWGDRLTETDGRQAAVWTDTASLVAIAPATGGWNCNYPSAPLVANLTAIGQGSAFNGTAGDRQIFREAYRGYWYNNVFMEQPKTEVEVDCPGTADANIDALQSATRNLPSGAASIGAGHPMLDFVNNFWYKNYDLPGGVNKGYLGFISTGNATNPLATARVRGDFFPAGDTTATGKNHVGLDPKLVSYETVNPPVRHQIMDLRPNTGSPLIGSAVTPPSYAQPNGAYTPTTYAGAFAPAQPMWIQEPWVTAYQYKIIPNLSGDTCGCAATRDGKPVVVVGSPAPSHTLIQHDVVFSADTIYNLKGFVAIDSGYTLFIEPGTTIKGDHGQAANATALIITPGARIIAPGTACKPIIFTDIDDNVDDPSDIPDIASSRGRWGGILIEGRAFTAAAGDTAAIEGVPTFTDGPWTARKTQYGGGATPDCHDNSGILQYISIRYAGSIIGANVEVNALSLGAVGDGTTIDHIETYYGLDDDIETWGGSVNLSYLCSFYGDDDCWDTDEGWAGVRQFGLEVKDPRWGDRLNENDGRNANVWTDTTSLLAIAPTTGGWNCNYPSAPLNVNLTMIGQGKDFSGTAGDRAIYREDLRAYWYNNVFMQQPKNAVEVDCPGGDANIDNLPSATRNLPGGAASIGAGHPLLDFVSNFYWKSWNKPSGAGSSIKHFIATGDTTAAPLASARVRNTFFPGGDTTLATGKNFLVNPNLTSYEVINPPVRAGHINPVPKPGGNLATKIGATVPAYAKPNASYVPVTYIGAFDPTVPLNQSWIWGWTAVSTCYGILGTTTVADPEVPTTCCILVTGNVNMSGSVDLADLSALVSYLTGGGYVLPCAPEANVNTIGAVDLADLSALVSYLTGGGYVLPTCP
jgi:hypothetical protein